VGLQSAFRLPRRRRRTGSKQLIIKVGVSMMHRLVRRVRNERVVGA
jgi:hypothetical protein